MTNDSNSPPRSEAGRNVDQQVVDDFGREWQTFNQSSLRSEDLRQAFEQYFHIFPFDRVDSRSAGFDMGCGSGRWAKLMAPRVGRLTCVDASPLALQQAQANLRDFPNVEFECASVAESTIPDGSQDFGYSLGVLHHVPDTLDGIRSCARKLKPGAPFLLYLYYRFDNKPAWFRAIWKVSDVARRLICALPYRLKLFVTQVIALFVYWPLSRIALVLEKLGFNVDNVPLSDYRNKPFYFLRTDALDRFGTRLEQRFTKQEIERMLRAAGFDQIRFSAGTPYWVAAAIKT